MDEFDRILAEMEQGYYELEEDDHGHLGPDTSLTPGHIDGPLHILSNWRLTRFTLPLCSERGRTESPLHFRSVEHFFQAAKFWKNDPAWAATIVTHPNPRTAWVYGNQFDRLIITGWDKIRDDVMRVGLILRLTQTDFPRKFLCGPDNDPIYADDAGPYWGTGEDGQNRLGELLGELRALFLELGPQPRADLLREIRKQVPFDEVLRIIGFPSLETAEALFSVHSGRKSKAPKPDRSVPLPWDVMARIEKEIDGPKPKSKPTSRIRLGPRKKSAAEVLEEKKRGTHFCLPLGQNRCSCCGAPTGGVYCPEHEMALCREVEPWWHSLAPLREEGQFRIQGHRPLMVLCHNPDHPEAESLVIFKGEVAYHDRDHTTRPIIRLLREGTLQCGHCPPGRGGIDMTHMTLMHGRRRVLWDSRDTPDERKAREARLYDPKPFVQTPAPKSPQSTQVRSSETPGRFGKQRCKCCGKMKVPGTPFCPAHQTLEERNRMPGWSEYQCRVVR